jgi:hypothetical protein
MGERADGAGSAGLAKFVRAFVCLFVCERRRRGKGVDC